MELLTVQQFAQKHNVSRGAVEDAIHSKRLPCVVRNNFRMIPATAPMPVSTYHYKKSKTVAFKGTTTGQHNSAQVILPDEMLKEIDAIAAAEFSTRSELTRAALRVYIREFNNRSQQHASIR